MEKHIRCSWIWLVLWVLFVKVGCSGVTPIRKAAARFFSNGDLISGWYWSRDPSFKKAAE